MQLQSFGRGSCVFGNLTCIIDTKGQHYHPCDESNWALVKNKLEYDPEVKQVMLNLIRQGASNRKIIKYITEPYVSMFTRNDDDVSESIHKLSISASDLNSLRKKFNIGSQNRHKHDPEAVRLLYLEWCKRGQRAIGNDKNPILYLKFEGEDAGYYLFFSGACVMSVKAGVACSDNYVNMWWYC